MSEQELLEKIMKLEARLSVQRANVAKAKADWIEAESNLVSDKIAYENSVEALRVYRNTTPRLEKTLREQEIEKFRQEQPELCAWAKERDLLKFKE